MSIKVIQGVVKIDGKLDDILAELSLIILSFRKGGISKFLIDNAIEVGFEEYIKERKENGEDIQNKDFRKLLRNLGLED